MISPIVSPTLLDVLLNPEDYRQTDRVQGLWRAEVVNTTDTQQRGRIQVRIIQLQSELPADYCPWAEPAFSYGGTSQIGLVAVPPVGATVIVGFELGFVDRPIWLGTWYGNPPEGSPEIPTEWANDQHIVLKTPSGHLLHFDSENGLIALNHSDGQKSIRLQDSGDKVQVRHGTTVIELEGSKVTITSQGDVEVNATGNAEVSCVDCDIQASGDVKLGAGAVDGVVTESFKTLFNSHTHTYNPGPLAAALTTPPANPVGFPTPMVAGTDFSNTVKAKL